MKQVERIAKLETQVEDHNNWLKTLEEGLAENTKTLIRVETQVTNHLPSQIKELRSMFWWLVTSIVGAAVTIAGWVVVHVLK